MRATPTLTTISTTIITTTPTTLIVILSTTIRRRYNLRRRPSRKSPIKWCLRSATRRSLRRNDARPWRIPRAPPSQENPARMPIIKNLTTTLIPTPINTHTHTRSQSVADKKGSRTLNRPMNIVIQRRTLPFVPLLAQLFGTTTTSQQPRLPLSATRGTQPDARRTRIITAPYPQLTSRAAAEATIIIMKTYVLIIIVTLGVTRQQEPHPTAVGT